MFFTFHCNREKVKCKEASSINAAGEGALSALVGLGQRPQLLIWLTPAVEGTAEPGLEPAGVRAGWVLVLAFGAEGTQEVASVPFACRSGLERSP